MFHKSPIGIYWRQIIKFDRIDVCQLLGGLNNNFIPLVADFREILFTLCPFLPRGCPMKVGKYYGYNLTMKSEYGESLHKRMSPNAMPNGQYRTVLKFFNDDDTTGASFWYHEEMYDASNPQMDF